MATSRCSVNRPRAPLIWASAPLVMERLLPSENTSTWAMAATASMPRTTPTISSTRVKPRAGRTTGRWCKFMSALDVGLRLVLMLLAIGQRPHDLDGDRAPGHRHHSPAVGEGLGQLVQPALAAGVGLAAVFLVLVQMGDVGPHEAREFIGQVEGVGAHLGGP